MHQKTQLKMNIPHKHLAIVAGALLVLTAFGSSVHASSQSQFSQVINAGSLATDIRDASRVPVASPTVGMSAITFSFDCQSGGSASSGTFGTNSQRVYVDNPDAADNGWTLTLAATSGATSLWRNGGDTQQMDFNDSGGSGCTDGGDADSKGGQMTVDPSVGTLTADCGTCTTSNITKGSSSAYVQGTTDSITLLTAAAASDDVGRWYFTGTSIKQNIPAEQPADTYTVDLTLTVTAS